MNTTAKKRKPKSGRAAKALMLALDRLIAAAKQAELAKVALLKETQQEGRADD